MSIPAIVDEPTLIKRARLGDTQAFEALVRRYERYIYNLALRVVDDPMEADDMAQQAFIRAWRGLPNFKGEAHFSTWLYRIVTNVCYSRLPRLKQDMDRLIADDEAEDLPDHRKTVEEEILTEEDRRTLQQALAELPESYRLLLTLRHMSELSYEEIAQATGMPLGTVKAGIFRARQRLKAALEKVEVVYEYR